MDIPALPPGFVVDAPALLGRAVLGQQWRDLAFLHWPVAVSTVQRFFPPGTRPDVLDDPATTYVGLVPFTMVGAGIGRRWPVPWAGTFLETNVRLYSVDAQGRHGVVFRSLDASRLLPVLAAHVGYGLPYVWSRMSRSVQPAAEGEVRTWTCARRLSLVRSRISVRVGPPVEPTPLDVFLTARWGLHARHLGRTWWVPNEHSTWPLRAAEVLELDDGLRAAAGVQVSGLPPLVRFTPGVRTAFGAPVPLPSA